ncbi:lmo0937 family membrane protein [Patescibacteria group bacterium]|nr:MAG: lmo0937 family membrane protein [Patescibacteria group bacterium]
MLITIAFLLIVLWLIGFIGFHVLGSFIHLLLVVAIIMFLIRIIQGRNPID